MKKNLLYILSALLLIACSEEERTFVKTDSVAPQPVSNVEVRNIPGGAVLKYTLPDDEDLLCVKANYELKSGVSSEVKASLFVDTLKIEGFGTEEERVVELVAIDRSLNESSPVKVTVKPLEAPVVTIGRTLRLIADFGGVHAYWENPGRSEISVVLEQKDNNNEFNRIDAYYSTVVEGSAATRGMDTDPRDFKIYIQDRWGNVSEALETTISPLFEEQFDRTKITGMSIEGDQPSAWGWVLANLFDGTKSDGNGFHTANGSGVWPQWITFDLGVTGQISRIKVWQRLGDWIFKHGNLEHFEIWGTADAQNLNDPSVWTLMMDCKSTKPSGLPLGQISDEDRQWAEAGEEFVCDPSKPKVRYLRLHALQTWSNGDFFHMSEIEVYGQVDKDK